MRQCACMKTNSIRTRTQKVIAGAALALVMSTPVLTHAADQLAWDKTIWTRIFISRKASTIQRSIQRSWSAGLTVP